MCNIRLVTHVYFFAGEKTTNFDHFLYGACMFDQYNSGTARDHTNVNEEKEVMYWAEQFACTPESLRIAVARVGVNDSDVK